jgi:two-component system sensor histidine kinase/response regulator
LACRNGQPYALELIDDQILGMDGLALARLIKEDGALADMLLILLTSFGQRGDGPTALHAGFAGYLVKPIRQAQLYDCIITVIGMTATCRPPTPITHHHVAEVQTQSRTRVLVAEDYMVNQKVAVRMLEKLGCRVNVAANGLETLEALGHCPYDLVFMDCQMPEMDGYTATAAIRTREQDTGHHIPIVAMTANAMQGDRDSCLVLRFTIAVRVTTAERRCN